MKIKFVPSGWRGFPCNFYLFDNLTKHDYSWEKDLKGFFISVENAWDFHVVWKDAFHKWMKEDDSHQWFTSNSVPNLIMRGMSLWDWIEISKNNTDKRHSDFCFLHQLLLSGFHCWTRISVSGESVKLSIKRTKSCWILDLVGISFEFVKFNHSCKISWSYGIYQFHLKSLWDKKISLDETWKQIKIPRVFLASCLLFWSVMCLWLTFICLAL